MKSFASSIFLIGLLFSCSAQLIAQNKATENSADAQFGSLAEMDQDHFGSTILSTISVHLSAQAPVEAITVLLENVRTNIKADQKSANQRFAVVQAGCGKELPEMKRNVKYHQGQLASYKSLRSNNQALFTKTTQSLALTNKDISANSKRFSEGRLQRKANHQEYLRRLVEARNAVIIIDEAVTLVEHIRQGTSFVQLKSHFDKVTEKLQAHVKSNTLYTPIISALASLATNADQSVVRRILGLLAKMRRSILSGKKTDTLNEARQIITWKKTKKNLEQERKNLLQKKKQLDNAVRMFKRIIKQSSKKIEEHSVSLLKYQSALKSKAKYCKSNAHQHVRNTKERKRNLAILLKLQRHFSQRMGAMKGYLKKRANH